MRLIEHGVYGIGCSLYQILNELKKYPVFGSHHNALKRALSVGSRKQLSNTSYGLISTEIANLVAERKYGIALAYYLSHELQTNTLKMSSCSKENISKIRKPFEVSREFKIIHQTVTNLTIQQMLGEISGRDIRLAESSLSPFMTQDQFLKSLIGEILEILRGYAADEDDAHDWDWHDPNWYNSLTPEPLVYPWDGSGHMGIDLSDDSCSTLDGWVLFNRRLLKTDGLPQRGEKGTELVSGAKYFALYNTQSGILRVFLYRDVSESGYPRDNLAVRCSLRHGTGSASDITLHDFFGLIGPISHTSSNPSSTENEIIYSMECITTGWIVIDIPISYSKYQDIVDEIWLHVGVSSLDEAEIDLNGELTFKIPVSTNRSIFGLLNSIISKVVGVGDSASSIKKAGHKLKDLGTEFNNAGGNGGLLTVLGATMLSSPVPVFITSLVAGTQVIQSIVDFSKAGGVKYAVKKGTLELSGSFINVSEEDFINIGMTRSTAKSDSVNFPYFYKRHPFAKLGFLRLDRLPLATIFVGDGLRQFSGGSHYFLGVALEQVPLESLLHVNTAMSGIELSDVKVQLVLERPFYGSDLNEYIVLGDDVVSEIDPKNEQDIEKMRSDFASYKKLRPAGYYKDGDQEKKGPPLTSIFRNHFEPISAYDGSQSSYGYGRLLVAHGTTHLREYGHGLNLWGSDRYCTRLFLRLHTVFESNNPDRRFEMVTTYEYPRTSICFLYETFSNFSNMVPWWD